MQNDKLKLNNSGKPQKPRLAIFDLTDCEGCELQFLALREELAALGHDFEVANWRLESSNRTPGPFDVTFIEGSPMTEADIETVKQARRLSKQIVTLGTCAYLGGVQAMFPEVGRGKALNDVYGPKYQSQNKPPKPVSYYIEVDLHLPGCPVNPAELKELLAALTVGKKFRPQTKAVCFDCKQKQNSCLFLDEGFCLGPVTRGGCGAPCPSAGLRCYGCFGPLPDANLEALEKTTPQLKDADRERALRLFFRNSPEYKDYQTKPKKNKNV